MHRTRVYRLATFLALGLLGSCSFFTEVCGCPPAFIAARAIGTVTRADGGPAAGAAILASAWRPPCDSIPTTLFTSGETTSDGQGAYRLTVITITEGLQCARVTARLGAAEVSRVVALQGRVEGHGPLDSVRVDLTLP